MKIPEHTDTNQAGIIESDERIQMEVTEYIAKYPEQVRRWVVQYGIALIPTYLGAYLLTEHMLEEMMR